MKKLEEFKDLSKDQLIDEMMETTIKGGCCTPSYDPETGNRIDRIIWEDAFIQEG